MGQRRFVVADRILDALDERVLRQQRKLLLHGRGRAHQPVAFLSAFRSLTEVRLFTHWLPFFTSCHDSMKIADLKTFVASSLLFTTASAQALQPEVLYGFELGPRTPSGSVVQGSDGNLLRHDHIRRHQRCWDGVPGDDQWGVDDTGLVQQYQSVSSCRTRNWPCWQTSNSRWRNPRTWPNGYLFELRENNIPESVVCQNA